MDSGLRNEPVAHAFHWIIPHWQRIPEPPERRQAAAPALSHKLHREAPVDAVDPETAFVDGLNAPTQEGG
jgi:hypothetical protein